MKKRDITTNHILMQLVLYVLTSANNKSFNIWYWDGRSIFFFGFVTFILMLLASAIKYELGKKPN